MKLFIILPRVPYPLEKGDKLRAFHQIRLLSEKHDLFLFCLNDSRLHPDAENVLKKYCKEITFFKLSKVSVIWNVFKAYLTGKPLQVGYFFNGRAKKRVDQMIKRIEPDRIFCQLFRVAEYVKDSGIPGTIDYQDVFSAGIKRRLEKSKGFLRIILKIEYKRVLKYEKSIFGFFDNKIIISEPDRKLIPHPERDKIVIVPNGVDRDYFSPVVSDKKYDLVFTGNMNYPPNVLSAELIVREILPLVAKNRDVRVVLAGANPHHKVLALQSDHVEVTGWVDDIRPYYASSRIFIAPMQIGTGLQNKLLEAMAMKIPCITSSLANQALGAIHKKEILIGDTPGEYATHIQYLLDNPATANDLAENGYNFLLEKFSWEMSVGKLNDVLILSGKHQ